MSNIIRMKKHTTKHPIERKTSKRKKVDSNKLWDELFNDPLSGEVLEALALKALEDVARSDYLEKGFG